MPPETEKVLATWSAPSRIQFPKNRQMFTTAAVIGILLSIVFLAAGEWMLVATIAALVFAFYLWANVTPESVTHSVTTWGIRTNGELYRWQEMSRWWTDTKFNHQILLADLPLRPPYRINLLLDPKSSNEITKAMTKYLLEEKPTPTAMDKFATWLSKKFPLDQA